MPKNEELRKILMEIKYRHGLTQSEISDKIGVNYKYLSNVLNGHYPFTEELREKLYREFTDLDIEKKEVQSVDEDIIKELQLRIVRLEAENNLLRELAGLNNRSEKNAL